MSVESDIQKSVWGGTVPLIITLAPSDLTDFVVPRPLHLTVPRMILWSSIITVVHSYFARQTAQLDLSFYPYDSQFLLSTNPVLEACAKELDLAEVKTPVWLQGPGKTAIDWRVPVGVCVDLWTSTAASAQYLEHPATFPIKIVAHFTKKPETLPDCHIVVCRGWSNQHRMDTRGEGEGDAKNGLGSSSASTGSSSGGRGNDSSSNKNKDSTLIAKHAMNTTKRALMEHNTRALLPFFLQLPSSTHNRAALNSIKMASTILHNKPNFFIGLKTPVQSQFVSCLFSNSATELQTIFPMCDCSQCTTFLTTLAGYDVQHGHISVPHKAAKAVKVRVQKVISVLKRDGSDSDEGEIASRSEDEEDKRSQAIVNMVAAGNDTLSNPNGIVHRGELTKEQRENLAVLTTPASMLLCQVTRLILLTRQLCGTLGSFEKALKLLEFDAHDTWRRTASRFEAEYSSSHEKNVFTTSTKDFFGDETPVNSPEVDSPTEKQSFTSTQSAPFSQTGTLPPLWQPHHNNIPIKLYTTQHVALMCTSKAEMGITTPVVLPPKPGTGPTIETKWSRYRLVSRIDQNDSATITAPNTPSISSTSGAATGSSSGAHAIVHLSSGTNCPYLDNLTIEQFLGKITPNWHYKYGKSPKQLMKEYGRSRMSSNGNSSLDKSGEYSIDITPEPSTLSTAASPTTTLQPPTLTTAITDIPTHNQLTQLSLDPHQSSIPDGLADDDFIVAVCHGVVVPFDTPIVWLYHHMQHADLTLHLTLARHEDVE